MEIDYRAIGKRIRAERKKQNLSQEQLAEMADLSPVHISHIETANTKLSLPALLCIINALRISADNILCDSMIASEKAYKNEILTELSDCDRKELKLLAESVKAIKSAYRELR